MSHLIAMNARLVACGATVHELAYVISNSMSAPAAVRLSDRIFAARMLEIPTRDAVLRQIAWPFLRQARFRPTRFMRGHRARRKPSRPLHRL
jgi:hypothetical protein